MIISIENRDLFTVPDDFFLAHCISADFALGAGIAAEFSKRFDMRNVLRKSLPFYLEHFINDNVIGDCIRVGRVFNLVTKKNYWNKPSYESLMIALSKLKDSGVTKLAIPKIGCGIDGLDWDKVYNVICSVFDNTDIEILVCVKEN